MHTFILQKKKKVFIEHYLQPLGRVQQIQKKASTLKIRHM